MALSDNPIEKTRKRNRARAIDAPTNKHWSDKQKLEALTSYLAIGNLALVARLLGIPEITLRVWKASQWWKEQTEELRLQESIELSNRMKRIVEASHAIVENRLINGDPVLNQKTGEIIMKPVSLKDAHKVATDLIDRKATLDKANNHVGPSEQRDENKLEALAARFAEMATKSIENNLNKKRTIDAEDISYAVYDEREEGLQEGIREISLEAGTNQESDSEDNGPEAS